MKLTFKVSQGTREHGDDMIGYKEPGVTCRKLLRLEVEVVLSYNKGFASGKRLRGILLFMEADIFQDPETMREALLKNRHTREFTYAPYGLEDPIDEVEIIDPHNLLGWLKLDPAHLLPHDQKLYPHDQRLRLPAPPAGG